MAWDALFFQFYRPYNSSFIYGYFPCTALPAFLQNGSLIALIIICSLLPFIIFYYSRKTRFLIYSLLIMTGYMVLLTLVRTGILSVDNIISLFIRGDNLDSIYTLTNRTLLWEQLANNMTLKTFLIGYGYSVIDKDFGIDFGTGILYGAHNAYLSVLLGGGIIALLVVLLYLGKNLLTIALNRRSFTQEIFYFLFSGYLMFFIISCFSEEIGINFSITFAFLVLITNIAFSSRQTT